MNGLLSVLRDIVLYLLLLHERGQNRLIDGVILRMHEHQLTPSKSPCMTRTVDDEYADRRDNITIRS